MKKPEKLKALAIQQRIEELKQNIYALECSDDMLFSNANGKLHIWEEMQKELRELMREHATKS